MPLFEYKCSKCGNTFEELVNGNRNQNVPCPRCKSHETEKLMSAIGGISMGKGSSPCGTNCANASSCAASGGACCHHAS